MSLQSILYSTINITICGTSRSGVSRPCRRLVLCLCGRRLALLALLDLVGVGGQQLGLAVLVLGGVPQDPGLEDPLVPVLVPALVVDVVLVVAAAAWIDKKTWVTFDYRKGKFLYPLHPS